MTHIISNKTVSARMISAHFVAGGLAYLIVCVLLISSGDAFAGHFFHPQLLAMVHLAALGWITMIIIGSIYQIVPVILNVDLFSTKLAVYTFISLIIGIAGLSCTFLHFITGIIMQVSAVVLLTSLVSFCVNIWFTASKNKKENIQSDFILTSLLWLLVTVILGTLLVFNLSYAFLPEEHLHYLKLHAHIGFGGWFILLVMGVLSKLAPMFLLSKPTTEKPLKISWYLVNLAISLFLIDMLFNKGSLGIVCWVIFAFGIGAYAIFIISVWKNRLRRKVDLILHVTYKILPVIFVALAIGLILLICQPDQTFLNLCKVYGTLVLGGFLTGLILAQTFKILPYLVWLEKYEKKAVLEKVPQPHDLYHATWLKLQFAFFIPGLVMLIMGIIIKTEMLIIVGSAAMLISAVFYNLNIFRLICVKPN
ncbi:hypothetical protein C3K47_16415 [Solitalea longa]|uniref:Cytochrome C oxidase subunit I n=1 Tax=Solitalea longa TaxID=2079460 RepID=A0A2S4ZXT7_9SPHI|nr:hypothetical protein [Solitalea longa]POY35164.1 hypothetical protein C3K47_16415 [Solitalea longa]